ncbi:hypothetical protein, partial [Spirillospora sp. NPDC047279]|uniref:hypothetical protein n=1 Tax=Spirillospora sp. NPDC047279 TaxID=3155478 RepID=UPI0033F500F9
MVSLRHEAPIKLIRDNPEVIGQLLSKAFDIAVPEGDLVTPASEELTKTTAAFRADNVVLFRPPDTSRPRLAVVVEQQLKKDKEKRFTWPIYITELRRREQCPALLVVLCPSQSVADWARTPITTGHPGFTLMPLVFGPDRPLVTTTAEAARNPELTILAVLAAVTRFTDRASLEVVHAALVTLNNAGHKNASLYAEMVLGLLPKPARHILEQLMERGTVDFKSDWVYTINGVTPETRGTDVPPEGDTPDGRDDDRH